MGLLSIFSRKPKGPVRTYDFTDEDRDKAREYKQIQHEMKMLDAQMMLDEKRLRHAQILDKLAEYEDEEDEFGIDGLFNQFLQNAMGRIQQPTPTPSVAGAPTLRHLSDEELAALKARIPAPALKVLAKKSDEELIDLARTHYPDIFNSIDEDSKRRALLMLKS